MSGDSCWKPFSSRLDSWAAQIVNDPESYAIIKADVQANY